MTGRDGKTLDEVWQGSPNAYLGTSIPGFPNLFLLLGPNTGLGHSSMIYMIESQIEHVIDALAEMRRHDADTVEVREDVARAFNAEVDKRHEGAVWNTGCSSWYLDDTGRNATLWPDWTFRFRQRTANFEPSKYELTTLAARARRGGRVSKRVIITGAAGGLGTAATDELRRQGATVVGLDLKGNGDDILECDVRDQASVDSAVAAAIEKLGGGVDVLVNNAGVGDPQSAGERPDETALAVIDINLVGAWRVTSAALPALLESHGRVVNIASGLAHVTTPFATAYTMAKRGLVGYSDSLRLEHADRLTVSTVYPGYIRTPIHDASKEKGMGLEGAVPAEDVADAGARVGPRRAGREARSATWPPPAWAP